MMCRCKRVCSWRWPGRRDDTGCSCTRESSVASASRARAAEGSAYTRGRSRPPVRSVQVCTVQSGRRSALLSLQGVLWSHTRDAYGVPLGTRHPPAI
eukprot:2828650-Prymnesium_polylepis.4